MHPELSSTHQHAAWCKNALQKREFCARTRWRRLHEVTEGSWQSRDPTEFTRRRWGRSGWKFAHLVAENALQPELLRASARRPSFLVSAAGLLLPHRVICFPPPARCFSSLSLFSPTSLDKSLDRRLPRPSSLPTARRPRPLTSCVVHPSSRFPEAHLILRNCKTVTRQLNPARLLTIYG